jgi:predicted NAD-dependent protein-ADP-ribosyltransferase YbiA (DUF1768 family)
MYPDSSEGLNQETDEGVYFFTVPFEPLNNWSPHRVNIWNNNFPTSEHAFQWKKFSEVEPAIGTEILNAVSPYMVAKITQANKDKKPKNWADIKVGIM